MRAEAGRTKAEQREQRIYLRNYAAAQAVAREARNEELEALRAKTERLRALRALQASKPST